MQLSVLIKAVEMQHRKNQDVSLLGDKTDIIMTATWLCCSSTSSFSLSFAWQQVFTNPDPSRLKYFIHPLWHSFGFLYSRCCRAAWHMALLCVFCPSWQWAQLIALIMWREQQCLFLLLPHTGFIYIILAWTKCLTLNKIIRLCLCKAVFKAVMCRIMLPSETANFDWILLFKDVWMLFEMIIHPHISAWIWSHLITT